MKNDLNKTIEQLSTELNDLRKKSKEREEIQEAANQQLHATEQQLRAANQQLEANNQQLAATEQQLRASNQQLEASNIEIRKKEKEAAAAQKFAENIILTLREPLLILDADLKVITANESFYKTFNVSKKDTLGSLVFELGNHQWDIPALRQLLLEILPEKSEIVDFEVKHLFDDIGLKTMLLNSKELIQEGGKKKMILLAIEDITERKQAEEKIMAAYQQLEANNQQLEASEQQLRAANQQLEANNQQLLATEQQLRAANQQLEANNQQLLATEQQLRAANQQLEANNQQLLATEQQLRAANQQLITNEHKLIKEKKFSESIVETANALIVGLDKDHKIRIFNQGAENITGYTKAEVIGKDWFKIFFPKELLNEMNKVWEDAWGITSHSYINPILSKAGKEIIVSWQTTGMYESEDASEHLLISIGEDISERKQAEKELTKLSTAATQSPTVIAITDTKGNLEYVNPKFTELTGYTFEEAISNNTNFLKSGDMPEEVYDKLWETISSGKKWRGEFHNKKKNGELYWESASVSPIFNEYGKIINYLKVAEDVTKSKRNEQIQHIIHQISNATVKSNSPEEFILIVKNELDNIIETNNFYVALYNQENDTISFLYHTDKKDSFESFPSGKTLTNYVIKTKKPLLATEAVKNKLVKSGELDLLGADSKIWLGVPLFVKGKVNGVLAVQSYEDAKAYDKTDMQTLEIISNQIGISLEKKKAEEDLKSALEKAEESNRLKTAFLNNISHEIRTPLNGILGFLEFVIDPDFDTEEKNKFIKAINTSSTRLVNTITDIINIAQIESSRLTANINELSLNDLLKEIYQSFSIEAEMSNIIFSYNLGFPNKEVRIFTDRDKLLGTLTNLIKNAFKFTKQGEITFGYTLKNNVLEFFVKDTGIGIPENRQEAIFDKFVQADIGDSKAFQGVGVGLSIAKAYVESLGGELWLNSKEGIGSEFYFTIPYNTADKKSIEKSFDKTKREYSNLTVLIAEDDEITNQYFETIFKDLFREIIFMKTGQQAIDACKNKPEINLVLMDIRMPDMNGYEATKQIRVFNKDLIIIAQTAYAIDGDKERAIAAGCNDYLSKPIRKEKLFGIINTHLN